MCHLAVALGTQVTVWVHLSDNLAWLSSNKEKNVSLVSKVHEELSISAYLDHSGYMYEDLHTYLKQELWCATEILRNKNSKKKKEIPSYPSQVAIRIQKTINASKYSGKNEFLYTVGGNVK